MTDIHIRPAYGEDLSFIFDTMLNSYRYGSPQGKSTPNHIFFDNYRLVIDNILSKKDCDTFVCCLPDEPDVILGYMICEPRQFIIHYVFVKQAFRKLGVATALYRHIFTDDLVPITYTHKTVEAAEVVKRPNFTFNPYLLYLKGAH